MTVRDNDGAQSSPVSAPIDAGNTAPQVTIDTPTTAARFAVGQTITLHGTATDAEDGALPSSSLSWLVLRHHDTHTHPFLAPTAGNDVQITQPAPEDLGSGIDGYLEVQLTATDSRGVKTTVTRNVLPRKVDLTFATSPAGRNVVLAGTTYTAPKTLTSWEGHSFAVDAPSQTDGSGTTWNFQSWSDGGAAAHSIVTPANPDDLHRHVRAGRRFRRAWWRHTGWMPGRARVWRTPRGGGMSGRSRVRRGVRRAGLARR